MWGRDLIQLPQQLSALALAQHEVLALTHELVALTREQNALLRETIAALTGARAQTPQTPVTLPLSEMLSETLAATRPLSAPAPQTPSRSSVRSPARSAHPIVRATQERLTPTRRRYTDQDVTYHTREDDLTLQLRDAQARVSVHRTDLDPPSQRPASPSE